MADITVIRTPTVLVLGAGASAPYDFPSGYQLLLSICAGLGSPAASTYRVLRDCGFSEDELREFARRLRRSGCPSVDTFIEGCPEFTPVGKAAIAACLIPFEHPEITVGRAKGQISWYEYLWGHLRAPWNDFRSNSLHVVTFNYDRSLEHYLYECLLNSTGRTAAECAQLLQQTVSVVHVHGALGELPELADGRGRSYSPELNVDAVNIAAAAITVMHEERMEDEYKRAHSLLERADQICFLGFGFHEQNVARLQMRRFQHPRRFIVGTTLGFTPRQWDRVEERLGGDLKARDDDIMQLLTKLDLFQRPQPTV